MKKLTKKQQDHNNAIEVAGQSVLGLIKKRFDHASYMMRNGNVDYYGGALDELEELAFRVEKELEGMFYKES